MRMDASMIGGEVLSFPTLLTYSGLIGLRTSRTQANAGVSLPSSAPTNARNPFRTTIRAESSGNETFVTAPNALRDAVNDVEYRRRPRCRE
jgi:phosphoglycerol transferase MdoB-like AlkP superfamily enzyme